MSPAIGMQPVQRGGSAQPLPPKPASAGDSGKSFAATLAEAQNVRFSNHAQMRLEKRNIELSPDGLNRLSNAVDKAGKRGGKESLVLVDDMAFLVNVPQRLVITAVDAQSYGDGVFTKIDSVVFADPAATGMTGCLTTHSA
ncbi:MAG: hypothetical protein PHQ40_12730 [Anaerolineaceae bacterium]|nr:hypothetical protein [Anaerolineaceae bacterium]